MTSQIVTYSGLVFDPLDPDPTGVCIEDIAHSLSQQCRFTGHTKKFYSVAEHSVLASEILPGEPVETRLAALLHDASEAYLSDIPRPLKRRPEFAFYREAETRAMATICDRFGLSTGEPSIVKHADGVLLATEARDLMAPLHADWHHQEANGFEVLPRHIAPRWWAEVERDFLVAFEGLVRGVDPRQIKVLGASSRGAVAR